MNKLLGILGVVAVGAVIIVGGALLRARLGGNGAQPLVNCETIPNPALHDKEFHFFLDLNPRNKNAENYELQSIEVSESGLAIESNDKDLRVNGPIPKKDPQLTQSIEVGKNTIKVQPLRDERDTVEQELLLHVGVKLKDKRKNNTTITSAICRATIIHMPHTVVLPPQKTVPPKPIPPIQIKDKEGNWVEPTKPAQTTPTTAPTTGLEKTASFFTKYQKYVTDNVTQLSVVVKPEDLAGKTVTSIEVALAARNYTLPQAARTSLNINDAGWYKSDWQCAITGAAVRCSGETPLEEGKYSVIGMDFDTTIGSPPPFLNATLYDADGNRVVGVGVEYKPE